MNVPVPPREPSPHLTPRVIGLGLVLGIVVLWAYGSVLASLAQRWSIDPQSSHGFLIPVLAVFLLWQRRDRMPAAWPEPLNWWGVAILAGSGLMRLLGVYFSLDFFDSISLVPAIAGVVILLGGRTAWRWAWPAVCYLLFMIPLPFQVETALSEPLQRLATVCSTYTLQTLGYPAMSEGNIIVMENTRVGVSEACNGLGMLMAFFAISTAVALVCDRPLLDRVILFLSAIPIGVFMNLVRITVTAVAHQTLGSEVGNRIFHDYAGWMMMPLAVAALLLELWLLKKLLVPRKEADLPAGSAQHLYQAPSRSAPVMKSWPLSRS
jgi:exosortase